MRPSRQRANRIARHLGGRGVRRGSRVAMLLPRSWTHTQRCSVSSGRRGYVPLALRLPGRPCRLRLQDSSAEVP